MDPIDLGEVRQATVIDLDWDAFPSFRPDELAARPSLHVATTGSDGSGSGGEAAPFRTISRALQAARPGQTIVVHGGTYAEAAEPGDYRGLVVNVDDIAITAFQGERVEVVPANLDVGYGIVVAARNVTLRGLRLAGFRHVGILFEANARGNAGIILADLAVEGSAEGIAVWEPMGAVDGLLAAGIEITGASDIGFHCGQGRCTNWFLDDVRIEMSAAGADDSGADAFAVEDGDNMLLSRVRVSGAGGDGIDLKATRVVVFDCRVEDVARNGLKLWHGGDVINTLIHHTGADAALVVENGPRVRLLHSLIAFHNFGGEPSYSVTIGYDSQDAVAVDIINSMIVNVAGGIYVSPASMVSIEHALFSSIGTGRLLDHGDREIALSTAAADLQRLGYGSVNKVADPELDERFFPAAGGPAIDAGIALPAAYPRNDALSRPRVQGPAPDLGPFEVR